MGFKIYWKEKGGGQKNLCFHYELGHDDNAQYKKFWGPSGPFQMTFLDKF